MSDFRIFWDSVSGKLRELFRSRKILISIGVAAVLCCAFVVLMQISAPEPDAAAEAPDFLDALLAEDEEDSNDLLANALSTGEYDDAILDETDDAGVNYVTDTLFLGDSNTAGMVNHEATTHVSMKNGIGVVSMGISHVMTLKCVKFKGMTAMTIPEAVKIMQPRRIVITYGTNDYHMTSEKFSEAYRNALQAIEEAWPYADIIIGSIFPITATSSYHTVTMPKVEKLNVELIKLAQEKKLHFLNWSESLKDPASGFCKPEYMAGDGIHLSKTGMVKIFDYFRRHCLDGEDRRPKPLKPIPVREATPAGLLGVGVNTQAVPEQEQVEPQPQPVVTVTVVFVYGSSGESVSYTAQPGMTVGPVTPVAGAGCVFSGWTGASGSGSFTVPQDAQAGQTYVITAIFSAPPPIEEPPDPPDPPPDPPEPPEPPAPEPTE